MFLKTIFLNLFLTGIENETQYTGINFCFVLLLFAFYGFFSPFGFFFSCLFICMFESSSQEIQEEYWNILTLLLFIILPDSYSAR